MSMTTSADIRQLIEAACSIRDRAYARYSNFAVGAALLAESGEIITGCNVENASYGLTICAERSALFTAVGMGFRKFKGIAIASPGGVPPCGACRQVLAEFCEELPVWMVDSNDISQVIETSLTRLFPGRFSF